MKAILTIGIITVAHASCGTNAKLSLQTEYISMEQCYEALGKAKIPSNAAAVCSPQYIEPK